MKKCPICDLNWINDWEDGCLLCRPKPKKLDKITRFIDLGSNSKLIYERFCNEFNWDRRQVNNFGYQRPLYARKADSERKRDVWFIFHSNLNNDSISENEKHLNIIKELEGTISEYYEDANRDVYPLADRIVFAKERDGGYKFLGVYKAVNPYSKDQGRLFIKTSDIYPIV